MSWTPYQTVFFFCFFSELEIWAFQFEGQMCLRETDAGLLGQGPKDVSSILDSVFNDDAYMGVP